MGNNGQEYSITLYNLDIILAVGYRVKSKRGIAFRKWANQVLKSYLLNGYSVNDKRCLECKDNLISLNNRVSELEKEKDLLKQEVFGDYYTLVKKGDVPKGVIMLDKIFNLAKEKIVIIDNYIDETIIRYIEKYNKNVVIITGNPKLKRIAFNSNITIVVDNSYHSRYIFVDNEFSYCLTYSLNSIGKKDFDIIFLDKLKPNYIINNNMI